jgi:hypothetical protein
MLSVVMLSVVMLSVVMLSVVMLSVVAPFLYLVRFQLLVIQSLSGANSIKLLTVVIS